MVRGFGNLVNRVMEENARPVPKVGDGATVTHYSDREAGTVVAVETHRKAVIVTVQEDKATRTDKNGMSESQSYDYAPDPRGTKYLFKRDGRGVWCQVIPGKSAGHFVQCEGCGVLFGTRDKYHDFSF